MKTEVMLFNMTLKSFADARDWGDSSMVEHLTASAGDFI